MIQVEVVTMVPHKVGPKAAGWLVRTLHPSLRDGTWPQQNLKGPALRVTVCLHRERSFFLSDQKLGADVN